jgi:competence protein ComEA
MNSKRVVQILKRYSFPGVVFAIALLCGMNFSQATMSVQAAQPQASPAKPATAPAKTAAPAKKPATSQIDINSATVDQLKAIPGIGDTYAQKIVDGRPYKMKTQLVSKKILSQAAYDKVSSMIIAKQPKSTAPAKSANQAKPATTTTK